MTKISFAFTKYEVEELKSKIFLSELEEKIFEYKLKDMSREKMAQLEHVSVPTIDRAIKKLVDKIIKVL